MSMIERHETIRTPIIPRWVTKHEPRIVGLAIIACLFAAGILIERNWQFAATLSVLVLGISCRIFLNAANSPALNSRVSEGADFATKNILRFGIALLGFRLTFDQITSLGLVPVFLSIAVVTLTLALGYVLGRRLGLSPEFSIIASGATAICGASAALALSATFAKSRERESKVVVAILIVTLLSTLAMISYPLLADYLQLTGVQAGILFGATIHDVAQVIGAGLLYGDEAVETSAYAKMLRVTLLAPIVIIVAAAASSYNRGAEKLPECTGFLCSLYNLIPPKFIIAFAAIVVVNNLIAMPDGITEAAVKISEYALIFALAGLALKTNLADIGSIGVRPVILLLANTMFVFALSLATVYFLV